MTLTMEPGPAISTSCGLLATKRGRGVKSRKCSHDGDAMTLRGDACDWRAYLFVPAEQDAHCLATALTAATRVDLRKTSRLRCDVA